MRSLPRTLLAVAAILEGGRRLRPGRAAVAGRADLHRGPHAAGPARGPAAARSRPERGGRPGARVPGPGAPAGALARGRGPELRARPPAGPAPLVFPVAGAGGSFDAELNRLIARVLHRQGMHVLGPPSPTHPNLIVNASETGVPGRMEDDARDLHRAMRLAYEQVEGRVEVTGFRLVGYSLGALGAAWVSRLDERARDAFGFEKVLVLNPPFSLFNSVNRLDAMYDRHVGDDPETARRLLDRVFARFAEAYAREDDANLDGEFLYRADQEFRPGPDAPETLIGASFRLSAVNMAFTSAVMSRSGCLVAPDAEPTAAT